MHILDLLEDYQTVSKENPRRLSATKFKKRMASRKENPNTAHALGTGAFGIVYPNTRDPHTVNRLAHQRARFDPYNLYAEWILKTPQAKSNPHFPRIQEVEKTTVDPDEHGDVYTVDTKEQYFSDYKIERLVPIDRLNDDQIEACYRSIFENDLEIVLASKLMSTLENSLVLDNFGKHTSQATWNNTREPDPKIASDSWNEARVLFRKFIAEFKKYSTDREMGNVDLHEGNIMFRLGPHAPIPVITDPVS